ncbi:phosphatidate cytidylyltransferase [Candidatus Babeliales bacterium]|nr:phosphatidate cytidylyltransferase [Candidatus Babeliales bacterium]MBP9844118.1 phosphatidate cytidylyltransferase [Candidatus Babeliales bacterium]
MIIINNSSLRIVTGLTLALTFSTLFFYCPPILLSTLFLCAIFIMILELQKMISHPLKFYTLALFYPITPGLILIYCNQTAEYRNLLLYLFVIVFSFDSASYFCGKLCSKIWTTRKIIPVISPGKSWEGAIGGYFFTTLIIWINMNSWYQHDLLFVYSLSAVMCTIAFCGDIFESYLKRSAKIKDSGTILPGHGGLLDRFDAVLAVSYFFFIFKDYLLIIF